MSNDATDRVRQVWDSQADKWFERREVMLTSSRPIHEWLVAHLDPQPGQRVLEIAAGPGDTGFLAARLLGNGRLLSTDLASVMVDAARQRAAELGITNVDHRLLDAQAMDLFSDVLSARATRRDAGRAVTTSHNTRRSRCSVPWL